MVLDPNSYNMERNHVKKQIGRRHHDKPGEERPMNGSPTRSAFTQQFPLQPIELHEFFNSYKLVSTCHFPTVHIKQTLRTDL